jgi:uncharacterized protein YcbK (DUF882 family)
MERRLPEDWRKIHLAEHFLLSEFVVSDSHPNLAMMIEPTVEQVNNLYTLCQLALEPIRIEYGFVSITRGLASQELNERIGGVPNSQHLYGEAVDFICPTVSMLDVYVFCHHNLEWKGELIYYKKKGHLHLSLPSLWVKPDHLIKEN